MEDACSFFFFFFSSRRRHTRFYCDWSSDVCSSDLTVELLLACGATVAVNHLPDDARARTELDRLRAGGGAVIAAPGDVSRPGEAEEMVRAAIDGLGRLDILVNNAGTPGTSAPIAFANLDAMTEKFWQTILATNLLGPFRCSHAAAPALRRAQGAIVNTASVAG